MIVCVANIKTRAYLHWDTSGVRKPRLSDCTDNGACPHTKCDTMVFLRVADMVHDSSSWNWTDALYEEFNILLEKMLNPT